MKMLDAFPQRSPEWFACRLGRLTGSRACDMAAQIKSGEAAARRDYRLELVCERLTGRPAEDGYVSKDMQRGTDLEPIAFQRYEAETGDLVRSTAFIQHDELMAGCSLDGDVDNFTGIVELKAPKTSTHIGYLRSKTVPRDYLWQITHNLWITGAEWADFVSYDDRLPEDLQFVRIRVMRADVDIAAYELLARQFLREVDAEVEAIQKLRAA